MKKGRRILLNPASLELLGFRPFGEDFFLPIFDEIGSHSSHAAIHQTLPIEQAFEVFALLLSGLGLGLLRLKDRAAILKRANRDIESPDRFRDANAFEFVADAKRTKNRVIGDVIDGDHAVEGLRGHLAD